MREKRIRRLIQLALIYALIGIGTAAVLLPYIWSILTALKPASEMFANPPIWISKNFTLEHFRYATVGIRGRYFLNSLILAASTSLLAVTLASFCAYGFSRFRFRYRSSLLLGILVTQMFPLAVLLIPLFIFWRIMGLLNTYPALIVTYLALTLPLSIWLLVSFFESIPKEIEEAAIVDGCSRIGSFFRIVLPLSKSGIMATFTYCVVVAWQEYLFALVFVTSESMRTVTIGLFVFQGQHTVSWTAIMAGAFLASLPPLAVFAFLQRFLIRGLTLGAVKG